MDSSYDCLTVYNRIEAASKKNNVTLSELGELKVKFDYNDGYPRPRPFILALEGSEVDKSEHLRRKIVKLESRAKNTDRSLTEIGFRFAVLLIVLMIWTVWGWACPDTALTNELRTELNQVKREAEVMRNELKEFKQQGPRRLPE